MDGALGDYVLSLSPHLDLDGDLHVGIIDRFRADDDRLHDDIIGAIQRRHQEKENTGAGYRQSGCISEEEIMARKKENVLVAGDEVTWFLASDEEMVVVDSMVDLYEEGPFRIIEVVPVPLTRDFCAIDRQARDGSDILTDLAMDLDHPDLFDGSRVVVVSPDGQVLKDYNGYQIYFDSSWFRRVKPILTKVT